MLTLQEIHERIEELDDRLMELPAELEIAAILGPCAKLGR